jgi:hypothetical protein
MGIIVGIMGNARSGKDTTALYLADKHRFIRVGLADPMKRFCKEVFDFTDEQLYGDKRDEPDTRYPRVVEKGLRGEVCEHLTPRYALQTLGTEWGRNCYDDIWIEHGVHVAQELIDGYATYSAKEGLQFTEKDVGIVPGVFFSDLRFINEYNAVKKAGGLMVRIKRPGATGILGITGHQSEEEQKSIPDDKFDVILDNSGDFAFLYEQIEGKIIARSL